MGGTLLLTFTRGSYLAITISIPVMILLYIRGASTGIDRRFYKKIILILLLLAIIGGGIVYIPHPFNQKDSIIGKLRQRVTIESITKGNSALRRIATWKFTWMMIKDYTLLGSGLGTYDYHTLKYQADFFAKGNNRDIYPYGQAAQAHNEYLQLWSELGIVGLLTFLWFISNFFRNVFKNIKKMEAKEKGIVIGLAGGITAVLIDALFGFPLQLAASFSLFWMFLVLAAVELSITCSNRAGNVFHSEYLRSPVQKKIGQNIKLNYGTKIIKQIFLSFLVVIFMLTSLFFLSRPFLARVYWSKGSRESSKGMYNEAIKNYEKGLQINPWLGELYYNIGVTLHNKGIIGPTLGYFLKAERFTDTPDLPFYIGSLYLKKNDYDEAILYFEKAIKYQFKKKDMLPLQLQLGRIYLAVKDYKNAERTFTKAIEAKKDNAEAYYYLA
ncbi:MAG TPA: O-antigen ligase family protein, partial [Atribacterota bacterium]|nr:O-antigen ligase family protein [Atribacterota bacterium]